MFRKQQGFVPIPVLIALIISALVGGYAGFKLGDGTFFSVGIGLGIVLVFVYIFSKPLKIIKEKLSKEKDEL